MKIEKREEIFARYLVDNNATIRQTACYFNISKSTVHNDISKKLSRSNIALFKQAQCVLEHNYAVKHLRGGKATALKYKKS